MVGLAVAVGAPVKVDAPVALAVAVGVLVCVLATAALLVPAFVAPCSWLSLHPVSPEQAAGLKPTLPEGGV